jgi:hypothetical protein
MSQGQKKKSVAVLERLEARHAPAEVVEPEVEVRIEAEPEELCESPLYGVAMLKIAMELKKADSRGLDEILAGVLARMRIPEEEFRRFLVQNGGLLKTIAQRRGYEGA